MRSRPHSSLVQINVWIAIEARDPQCATADNRRVLILRVRRGTDRPAAHLEIARAFFSSLELASLTSLPPTQQKDRFFDIWTLKEAYAKARGMGMSLPFHAFAFDLSVEQPPRISFSPELADDPDDWRFRLWSPTGHHRLAVAVRLRHS